jgi:hypothetical protein
MTKGRKSTISHELKLPSKFNKSFNLLVGGVLSTLSDQKVPESAIYRTKLLRRHLQFQIYRWIQNDPSRALEGTFNLNCPPTGLIVRPITAFCNNIFVCPWCFVRRRLLPIYEAIRKVPAKHRTGYKIVSLKMIYPANTLYGPGGKLPFFRRDRGPHSWSDSLVTVQSLTPFIAVNDEDQVSTPTENTHQNLPSRLEHLFHVIQVVPETLQPSEILERIFKKQNYSARFSTSVAAYSSINNVFRVLAASYQLPWLQLYRKENLENYSYLKTSHGKTRTLRINSWNEVTNG